MKINKFIDWNKMLAFYYFLSGLLTAIIVGISVYKIRRNRKVFTLKDCGDVEKLSIAKLDIELVVNALSKLDERKPVSYVYYENNKNVEVLWGDKYDTERRIALLSHIVKKYNLRSIDGYFESYIGTFAVRLWYTSFIPNNSRGIVKIKSF